VAGPGDEESAQTIDDEGRDEDVLGGRAAVEGYFDPAIADGLDAPAAPDAIYEDEVSIYRPVFTGDIFQGAEVPGVAASVAPHDLVMVVAHPSAMRTGPVLRPTLRAAPIVPVDNVSPRKWVPGFFDLFPLPLLDEVTAAADVHVERHGWAALLDLSAPLSAEALDINRRIGCLSPDGIHLLLQRLVHSDTRFAVQLKTLATTFAPKLIELDYLYTWNEEFVPGRVDAGGTLEAELRTAAEEFEVVMTSEIGDSCIRSMIEEIPTPGEASRAGEAQRHFNDAVNVQRRRGQAER
jgi:hypothetical protein